MVKNSIIKFSVFFSAMLYASIGMSAYPVGVPHEVPPVHLPEIVGGGPSPVGARPYQVALLWKGSQSCGGPLCWW